MTTFPIFVTHDFGDADVFFGISEALARFGMYWLSKDFNVLPRPAGQRQDKIPPNSPIGAFLSHIDNGGRWDPDNHDYDHHTIGGPSSTSMIFDVSKDRYSGIDLKLHRRIASLADRLDAHVSAKNNKVSTAYRQLRYAIDEVNKEYKTRFILTQGDYFPGNVTSPLFSLQSMVDLGEITELEKIQLCLTLLRAWWVKKYNELDNYETLPGFKAPYRVDQSGELHELIDAFLHEAEGFNSQLPRTAHPKVIDDLRSFNNGQGLQSVCEASLKKIQQIGAVIEEVNKELGTGFQITHAQRGPWELIYWYETLGGLSCAGENEPEQRTEIMQSIIRAHYLDEVISRDIIKAYMQSKNDPENVFFAGHTKIAVFPEMPWWPKKVRHVVNRRLSWANLSLFVTQSPGVIAITTTRNDGEQLDLTDLHTRLQKHAPDLGPEDLFLHDPGKFVIYDYHPDKIGLEIILQEIENSFGKQQGQKPQSPLQVAV
jgi:hypothetical protein